MFYEVLTVVDNHDLAQGPRCYVGPRYGYLPRIVLDVSRRVLVKAVKLPAPLVKAGKLMLDFLTFVIGSQNHPQSNLLPTDNLVCFRNMPSQIHNHQSYWIMNHHKRHISKPFQVSTLALALCVKPIFLSSWDLETRERLCNQLHFV